jgi:hypothetical protein
MARVREAGQEQEIIVRPLGAEVEIQPGLFLTFSDAQVGPADMTWKGMLRNAGSSSASFSVADGEIGVTDSTQKPYTVSSVSIAASQVPPEGSMPVQVTATILSFSPIPPGATYLDLQYTRKRAPTVVFRREM